MQCLSNKKSVKRLKKIVFTNIYLLFDILLGLQLIAFKFRLCFDASHVNAFKVPRLLNMVLWWCSSELNKLYSNHGFYFSLLVCRNRLCMPI